MKKIYSLPGLGLALVFLIVSFIFINKSVKESNKFKEEKVKVSEILNFNDRLLSFRDWVFSKDAWDEKKAKLDVVMKESDAHYEKANTYGYYLLFTCLAFFILIVAIYGKKRIYFGLTFAICFISIVLLGQGVMNPILEMSAFKEEMTIKVYVHPDDIPYFDGAVEYIAEVNEFMGDIHNVIDLVRIVPYVGPKVANEVQAVTGGAQEHLTEGEAFLNKNRDNPIGFDKVFPGRTYFYYQNKGIMDVITLLWKHDNKPVAVAIGTFSVVVPGIKLIATLLMLLFGVTRAKRFRKFLSYIAKFSMADVFVVSAFLSYLSFANMSAGVDMDAKVLFGLYYFMGYVVLSIFLGLLLDRSIKVRIDNDKE
ncbi:paraquat-inducible protein A [Crocinitomicaceae bacterium]|nr:paraquat-inducible protein A [Crocinitomicaceae bacterium]